MVILLDFLCISLHAGKFCMLFFFRLPIFFKSAFSNNSLDPGQADILSGLICIQTVCKGYQQLTLAGKEFKCNQ